jgi:hypothetical protein
MPRTSAGKHIGNVGPDQMKSPGTAKAV